MDRASEVRKRVVDSRRPGKGADDGFRYARPSRARGNKRGRRFVSDGLTTTRGFTKEMRTNEWIWNKASGLLLSVLSDQSIFWCVDGFSGALHRSRRLAFYMKGPNDSE